MTGVRATLSITQRRNLLVRRHRHGVSATTPGPGDSEAERSESTRKRIRDTADDLVALHSSDPVSVYLSVLARVPEATVDAISDVLYRSRDLVRVHGMRRTLWVATKPVAAAIVASSATRLIGPDLKRLATFMERDGLTDDAVAWIDNAAIELLDHVDANGPCTARDVGEALPHLTVGFDAAPGKRYTTTIAAHTRVLLLLGFTGRILRGEPLGTWIGSQYRWVVADQWLGEPLVPPDRLSDALGTSPGPSHVEAAATARRQIIERYLDRFGPATEIDIAWWTGWPKGMVRKALSELSAVEVDVEGADNSGWVLPGLLDEATPEADLVSGTAVAVLPGLDPTTMGWKERAWYLEERFAEQLFDRNGNGGPTIWCDGRIVGGWAQRDNGELVHELFTDIGKEAEAMVEAELHRLAGAVGDTTYKVRFPSPLNRELTG